MVSTTIEAFLAFRLMQATVASAIALSRAIVRDMVGANEAASLIGYVTMGMSVAPMVSPMIGGFLDEHLGWQAVFAFTFAVGAITLALMWADLGETNAAPSTSFVAQFRAYPELFRSHRFWGYSLTAALASGAFFAFLGGGPLVASRILGMGPAELGFYFGFIALGYMLGNFLSGRYASRVGLNRMMLVGGMVASGGILLALARLRGRVRHAAGLLRLGAVPGARQRAVPAERQRRHRLGAAASRGQRLGPRRRADDRRRRGAVGARRGAAASRGRGLAAPVADAGVRERQHRRHALGHARGASPWSLRRAPGSARPGA